MSYRTHWCGDVTEALVGQRGEGGRVGQPAARPRRAVVHRPARSHRHAPAGLRPGTTTQTHTRLLTACGASTSFGATGVVRARGRGPRQPQPSPPARWKSPSTICRTGPVQDAPVLSGGPSGCRRDPAAEVPLHRPSPPDDAAQPHAAGPAWSSPSGAILETRGLSSRWRPPS